MSRCIFCKETSVNSRSVEHIIPQSLGNTTSKLPPGIVCDTCNNYFAVKVEKPFLESPGIQALRFHQAIPNKKGRTPALDVRLSSGEPGILWAHRDQRVLTVSDAGAEQVLNQKVTSLLVPNPSSVWAELTISRLLAKVAVEAAASRVLHDAWLLDSLISDQYLDSIRGHARYGRPAVWSYTRRRIYDVDQSWGSTQAESLQRAWEWDFVAISDSDLVFVIAIFGLEMAINLYSPSITTYQHWMESRNGTSPLHPDGIDFDKAD